MTTCMRTQAIGLSSSNNSMWWKVDLGGFYNVYRITIMFKNYEEYPINGILALIIVYVYLSNTICNCIVRRHKSLICKNLLQFLIFITV